MSTWTHRLGKKLVSLPLELLLSRRQRIRLGRHILDTARGDNDGDYVTNGELYVIEQVRRKLAGDGVVLDVGANLGEWTAALRRGVSEKLRVYCFEPCRGTFEQLARNLSELAGVTPVNAALGRAPGKAQLHVTGEFAGTQSLVKRETLAPGSEQITSEEIVVCQGDEFCREQGIGQVDFVKIDTEGYELEVLKGFGSMLAERKIGCLQFEYGGTWIDARILLKDVFALLLPMGYQIGKIHPKGVQWWGSYDVRLETFQFANFLAMREDWMGAFETI